MGQADFWDDQSAAQTVINECNQIKSQVNPMKQFKAEMADYQALVELVDELGGSDEAHTFQAEINDSLSALQQKLEQLELASFLSGPNDGSNALLTIHAGAGGTESWDWAATLRIEGLHAFGYAKAERGVHRLVRISPFDSNARRHTSFSSVDVIAEIEDTVDIEIDPSEIRTDVYRASGKGGQHVNRTESAVRLTHIPTNIVVTCQNDRSQIKNKATAMRTLKSRLYEKMQDEKRSEMERFYGEKGEIAWGNQIRSYVFQPYQMVKDLRTGVESGNVSAVMDGDVDPFIHAWLRAGGPLSRQAAADRGSE